MRKIVLVRRKKEIILKKYFGKKRHYAGKKKKTFRKKKWKFLRRKQFKRKTSKVCFVCRRPSHFAKNCPKKEKAAKLLEQAQIHADDVPFSEEDSDPNSEYDSDPEIQTIYTSQPIIAPLTNPTPIAQVHLLPDIYTRPIPVIALFDTEAATTILHPKILSEEFWLSHHQMFRAANGETFLITQKSKPIFIKIFPTLTIKHQVLGSPFTGRDLLIGFDLLHQIPSLRWSSKGLMHKQHLLTWTQVPHLFTVDSFDSLKLQIISDCCANSHSEFLLKNPNPLWKNPKFFVYLPFKKNEDVNSTKASHKGMNLEHLALATQELSTLLSEGLIEPTTFPWACEVFYVNKHVEQVRGKLRFVINY